MRQHNSRVKRMETCVLINSNFGNPRYLINWEDTDGNTKEGKTQTNATSGYKVVNAEISLLLKQNVSFVYHYTKIGNIIIDSIIIEK